jgi:hypothetical protein
VARSLATTAAYRQSRKDRKKVEMGASDEFLLAATAQSLRRMAKRWLGSPPTAVPIPV